jgi:uncharacterized repeat protein (TIGR02543 family)
MIMRGDLDGKGTVKNFGAILVRGSGTVADGGEGNGKDSLLVGPNNYALTFDANGGTLDAPATMRVFALTVSASRQRLPTPTRAGFVFLGWNIKLDGSGTVVGDGTDLHGVFGDGPVSRTLYAQWPAILIAAPGSGATYAEGESVTSAFSCTAGAGGPAISPCLDQDDRASGSPVDTSTAGSHTFTVRTVDGVSASVTYMVSHPPSPNPPTASITTPANSASYAQGASVTSAFSCTEGAGGPPVTSCVDQNGRASGNPVATSTPGRHTFTATATSASGLTGTASVTYTVKAAPPAACQDPSAAFNQGFNASFNPAFNAAFNPAWKAGFPAGFNRGFDRGFGHAGDVFQAHAQAVATAADPLPPECNADFNHGFNAGFNPAFNSGFNRGWHSGFNHGFNTGFNAGHNARHH